MAATLLSIFLVWPWNYEKPGRPMMFRERAKACERIADAPTAHGPWPYFEVRVDRDGVSVFEGTCGEDDAPPYRADFPVPVRTEDACVIGESWVKGKVKRVAWDKHCQRAFEAGSSPAERTYLCECE